MFTNVESIDGGGRYDDIKKIGIAIFGIHHPSCSSNAEEVWF